MPRTIAAFRALVAEVVAPPCQQGPTRRTAWTLLALLCCLGHPRDAAGQTPPGAGWPTGDAVIRGRFGDSEIVVTTTARLAGAIHSVTWQGREFIDSHDHGRQLQSAANFDAGSPLTAETFNPTEAGAERDGAGPTSTSRLLHFVATPDSLQSTTQMAFWLAPGQKSGDHFAKNATRLSNHLLTKRVRVGHGDLPNVLRHDITFSVPVGEKHQQAVFEVLTGYMPPEFERFWAYDAAADALRPLDDGPGEQARPVVLATADGALAMGVYSPEKPRAKFGPIGYGRFRFTSEKVVKWNCVFRLTDRARGVAAGEYAFRVFVALGDLETTRATLRRLCAAEE